MASSGSYSITSYYSTTGTNFTLKINWSETYNTSTKKHRVTITSVELPEGTINGAYPNGTISINNTVILDCSSFSGNYYLNTGSSRTLLDDSRNVATGYVDIAGSSTSGVSISISVGGNDGYGFAFYGSSGRIGPYFSGTQTAETIYTLTVNAGDGSTITVNRTTAAHGSSTGNISNGAKIYNNDVLKISFAAASNYALLTHTVNGNTFTSGNTKTVSGNVTVAATAQPLSSDVAATDANIDSVSTITVTKHSSSYYHSLQYSFGSISGYITASGGVSNSEVKMSKTSVAFTVPSTFYAEIPNAKSGTCTITCRTYKTSSSTSTLGSAKTCTFTATASSQSSKPTVDGTVVDINDTTIALTGDANKLIKYKSKARATISATAQTQTGASISSKRINDVTISGTYRTFTDVEESKFTFSVTDSRGYSASKTVSPTVVAYIPLTLNITIGRVSPTSDEITLSFNGNYYNGSFGVSSNTLQVQYRYKAQGSQSYSSWSTISASNYSKHNGYYTTSASVSLGNSFDYTKSYTFQVKATDALMSTTAQYVVQKGTPVFDWGENDFRFNVPVSFSSIAISGGGSADIQMGSVERALVIFSGIVSGVRGAYILYCSSNGDLTYTTVTAAANLTLTPGANKLTVSNGSTSAIASALVLRF